MQSVSLFLPDPNRDPDWAKRDGHNGKNPANTELFHLKYVHIIIKIQQNTDR